MLIPWPMSFGIVVFFGTVSKNMLLSGLLALQFWDCLEKYAHMSIFFETVPKSRRLKAAWEWLLE